MKKPKFKVGDKVNVTHRLGKWSGKVLSVNCCDENVYEYDVSNSPLMAGMFRVLLWEHQLEKCNVKKRKVTR